MRQLILWLALAVSIPSLRAHVSEFEQQMGKGTEYWIHISKLEDVQALKKFEALYEKNKIYRFTEEGEFRIPKVIHFIWLGPAPFPPQSVENVRSWIAKHPNWKVKFWTDRDRFAPCNSMEVCDANQFPFLFLRHCFEESKDWREMSDILRFEILYQEGGLYLDHDASCLQNFDSLHRGYHFFSGLETPHAPFAGRNISSGLGVIGSCPFHPVVGRVIELIGESWSDLGIKYRGKDFFSQMQLVRERTTIPLTVALLERMDEDGNIDIVFPAAYFYGKKEITPIYSRHLYQGSCPDSEMNTIHVAKNTKRALGVLKKKSNTILWIGRGTISINLLACVGLFLYLFRKKQRGG